MQNTKEILLNIDIEQLSSSSYSATVGRKIVQMLEKSEGKSKENEDHFAVKTQKGTKDISFKQAYSALEKTISCIEKDLVRW